MSAREAIPTAAAPSPRSASPLLIAQDSDVDAHRRHRDTAELGRFEGQQPLAGLERVVPIDTTAGCLTPPCGPFLCKLGAFWRLCFGRAMIMTRRKVAWSSR